MKKKLLSILLVALMVCTMMSVMSFTASADHYEWPNTIDEFAMPSGSGTKNDPFIIMNEDQFWAMSYRNYFGSSGNYGYFGCADCYNNKCNSNHEHYFELGADITFKRWDGPYFKYGFYPIGCYNDSYAFNGKLDGKGHKLINFTLKPEDGSYWGLFGRSKNAKFSNIVFENGNFEYVADSTRGFFSHVNYSAFLVGYAQDTTFENITFKNCKLKANSAIGFVCGQADNCKFKNIQINNQCSIVAGSSHVGCVAGIMKGAGSISESKVEGSIIATGYIGGYVGQVVPSYNNSIWFNNIERGNVVQRDKIDGIFTSQSSKLDSMGVFVGVADYGFTPYNIKNATLYVPNKNPEKVYNDLSNNSHNYLRYLGKYQTTAGGSYGETNFITSGFSEKMIHNKDDDFKIPSNLDILPELSTSGSSTPLLTSGNPNTNRPFENGDYKIYSALNNSQGGKMCVDIDGSKGAKNSSDNVHLWSDSGAAYNVFTITWDANTEAYIIKNKHSGLVLDVAGGSTENGANLQQWGDNGTDAQRWVFESAGNGNYFIRNKQNRYMDVDGCVNGALPKDDTNIQAWSFTGATNQQFGLVDVSANNNTGSVLSEGNMTLIIAIVAAVVFGLGGFFAGNVFGKKKTLATANGAPVENKNDEDEE